MILYSIIEQAGNGNDSNHRADSDVIESQTGWTEGAGLHGKRVYSVGVGARIEPASKEAERRVSDGASRTEGSRLAG